MPRKAHRVKSDFLYRLCRVITDGVYSKLKAYNDVYAKGSKQWRLIDYYRGLERWDKQRERQDWAGENLAALKYNTLNWLLLAMSKIGDWPQSDIHALIGGIRWGLKAGANEELLDFVDEAKELSWKTEAYNLFEEALGLEWMIVSLLDDFSGRESRIKNILKARDHLETRKREINDVFSIRLLHFEPARKKTVEEGVGAQEKFEALFIALSQINPKDLEAGEALLEYHALNLRCQWLKKEDSMVITADIIGNIYETRPWLMVHDTGRYFRFQRDRVLTYMLANVPLKAKQVLAKFDLQPNAERGEKLKALVPKLWSYFYIYDVSNDLDIGAVALHEFSREFQFLDLSAQEKDLSWLFFFAAKAAMDLSRFKEALDALENVLTHSGAAREITLIHARVMMLVAYLGLEREQDFVYSAAVACSKFLYRHKRAPQYLHVVVRGIMHISKTERDSSDYQHVFQRSIQAVSEAFTSEHSPNAVSYRYHLAMESVWRTISVKRNLST